jgi:ATP-binding cassette subfamily F protein uup
MAQPPLIHLRGIHLTFGGRPLLEDVELSLGARERLCLVGPNGSGKSTVLKIAAGLVQPDGGSVFVQPSLTVRYLPQEPDLSGFGSTAAFVEAGLGPGTDPHRALTMLQEFGLAGDEDPRQISGGEARRAALARVLAPDPDVLLLDEPTNHLDVDAIEALEGMLARRRSAIVLISHDRRFLENLSNATVWLDRGLTRRLDRGFAAFEAWRDEVLEIEQRDSHKLDRKIVREEHWIRYGVTARRKRNQGRLRALRELRVTQSARRQNRPLGGVVLNAADAAKSGKLVIEAKGIEKSYDGRPIVRDFSLTVQRGDRIGLVGPNGAGKTTLLNLLTGVLTPDSGTVRLGTTLEIATLDQNRDLLDPSATLAGTLTGGHGDQVMVGTTARHVIGYLKDFLFRPEQARTPVAELSGGEKGRLVLARALARPSNMLILDEPTNDLDLETLDLLQEMLADYPGTVLLVSHDRDFLDRVVTSVLVAEGDGHWTEYAGGYSDMIAQRGGAEVAARSERSAAKVRMAGVGRAKHGAHGRKSKLTYKDQHALRVLPGEIASLTGDIARLQTKLSVPDFYAVDPAGFAAAGSELESVGANLAAAEDKWLRLELKREEIEG